MIEATAPCDRGYSSRAPGFSTLPCAPHTASQPANFQLQFRRAVRWGYCRGLTRQFPRHHVRPRADSDGASGTLTSHTDRWRCHGHRINPALIHTRASLGCLFCAPRVMQVLWRVRRTFSGCQTYSARSQS